MLTVAQIAQQLNISQAIVYGWVSAGLLAAYRLGAKGRRGAIRIAEADLNGLLESLKTQGGQKAAKPPAPAKTKRVKLQHLKLKPI